LKKNYSVKNIITQLFMMMKNMRDLLINVINTIVVDTNSTQLELTL
jgi:hypothetical protein